MINNALKNIHIFTFNWVVVWNICTNHTTMYHLFVLWNKYYKLRNYWFNKKQTPCNHNPVMPRVCVRACVCAWREVVWPQISERTNQKAASSHTGCRSQAAMPSLLGVTWRPSATLLAFPRAQSWIIPLSSPGSPSRWVTGVVLVTGRDDMQLEERY